MKKNLLIGAVVLGAASLSLLTGFDSALSSEEIIAKSREACADLDNLSATADINIGADIAVPAADISMGISLTGSEAVAATIDPLAMAADAKLNASLLGQEMAVDISVYGVMGEDGQFTVYTKPVMEGEEDASWSKTSTDGSQISALLEQVKTSPVSLPVEFELSAAPVQLDDKECYELTGSITMDELFLLLQSTLEQYSDKIPMDEVETYASLLSGLKFYIVYYINTENFYVEYAHIDLNESDWTTIAALLASMFGTDENGDAYQVTLNVGASDIDFAYDYETPVEIVVPADALAADEVDTSSLLDMVENAEDAA